jgi:hypothetical protein
MDGLGRWRTPAVAVVVAVLAVGAGSQAGLLVPHLVATPGPSDALASASSDTAFDAVALVNRSWRSWRVTSVRLEGAHPRDAGTVTAGGVTAAVLVEAGAASDDGGGTVTTLPLPPAERPRALRVGPGASLTVGVVLEGTPAACRAVAGRRWVVEVVVAAEVGSVTYRPAFTSGC